MDDGPANPAEPMMQRGLWVFFGFFGLFFFCYVMVFRLLSLNTQIMSDPDPEHDRDSALS